VDCAEDRAFVVRTTLNVVLIFVRHDGRVMSYRPSGGRLNCRPIKIYDIIQLLGVISRC
jgi:hypothetical protein